MVDVDGRWSAFCSAAQLYDDYCRNDEVGIFWHAINTAFLQGVNVCSYRVLEKVAHTPPKKLRSVDEFPEGHFGVEEEVMW